MRSLTLLLLGVAACSPHPATVETPPPVVAIEAPTADSPPPYDRNEWGRWIDADGDCQDTRQEVLIAESLDPVVLDEKGCKVVSGRWKDPYTASEYTNPSDLDIDHLVALKTAFDSGAWQWDAAKKNAYFNDLSFPDHLIATSASANRSKGSRTPLEWMPPNETFHCEYLRSWMLVKAKWELEVPCEEGSAIAMMMAQACK